MNRKRRIMCFLFGFPLIGMQQSQVPISRTHRDIISEQLHHDIITAQ